MAQVEPVAELNGVTDDFRWKPVPLIFIHPPILSIWAS
jgi:hypothetical protein